MKGDAHRLRQFDQRPGSCFADRSVAQFDASGAGRLRDLAAGDVEGDYLKLQIFCIHLPHPG